VGTVLAINKSCIVQTLRNHWYEFMPFDQSCCTCGNNGIAMDGGLSPVFNNIPCGESNYIQVYNRDAADNGKEITFYGVDANGWETSETIVMSRVAPGYVRSTNTFQSISRVSKETTIGIVDVYQYRASDGLLLDLAHYYGAETEPMYAQTNLSSLGCSCDTTSVVALIKLAYVPMVNNSDVAQIENLAAIKLMVQAIKLEDANDKDASVKMEVSAIHELNQELRNKMPDNQTAVFVRAVNGSMITNPV
jgi:hypothetical protein